MYKFLLICIGISIASISLSASSADRTKDVKFWLRDTDCSPIAEKVTTLLETISTKIEAIEDHTEASREFFVNPDATFIKYFLSNSLLPSAVHEVTNSLIALLEGLRRAQRYQDERQEYAVDVRTETAAFKQIFAHQIPSEEIREELKEIITTTIKARTSLLPVHTVLREAASILTTGYLWTGREEPIMRLVLYELKALLTEKIRLLRIRIGSTDMSPLWKEVLFEQVLNLIVIQCAQKISRD